MVGKIKHTDDTYSIKEKNHFNNFVVQSLNFENENHVFILTFLLRFVKILNQIIKNDQVLLQEMINIK